ncbi:MAG: hypothetical protein KJ569_07515 [Candidatus Omnitrophica bacterium]|nr:hypothetical protein [Candidatus Omnitrophota bacterium]
MKFKNMEVFTTTSRIYQRSIEEKNWLKVLDIKGDSKRALSQDATITKSGCHYSKEAKCET